MAHENEMSNDRVMIERARYMGFEMDENEFAHLVFQGMKTNTIYRVYPQLFDPVPVCEDNELHIYQIVDLVRHELPESYKSNELMRETAAMLKRDHVIEVVVT